MDSYSYEYRSTPINNPTVNPLKYQEGPSWLELLEPICTVLVALEPGGTRRTCCNQELQTVSCGVSLYSYNTGRKKIVLASGACTVHVSCDCTPRWLLWQHCLEDHIHGPRGKPRAPDAFPSILLELGQWALGNSPIR